jgi:uncharacterized SAM-binding protein YcdF (DUF218 family)
MYVFSKLVTVLISPLGSALVLMTWSLWALWRGSHRGSVVILLIAWVWLYLWSTWGASMWLRTQIESQYPYVPPAQQQMAPVAVVLGGGISSPVRADSPPNLERAADRYWHAAQLYHAGKAPVLVLSGGGDDTALTEAQSMALFLQDLGVPESALVLEGRSRNTGQNAVEAAIWLRAQGVDRILLVTSALHMPRAIRLFEIQGLQVIAAPTDYEQFDYPLWRRWWPEAEALEGSARAMKELLGAWLAARGWAGA